MKGNTMQTAKAALLKLKKNAAAKKDWGDSDYRAEKAPAKKAAKAPKPTPPPATPAKDLKKTLAAMVAKKKGAEAAPAQQADVALLDKRTRRALKGYGVTLTVEGEGAILDLDGVEWVFDDSGDAALVAEGLNALITAAIEKVTEADEGDTDE